MKTGTALIIGGMTFAALAFFLPATFGFGTVGFAPPMSVASGAVYDVFFTYPNNTTKEIASCVTFANYLSLAAAAPPGTQTAAIPDSDCGPINLVTSTTIAGTTFTNALPSSTTSTTMQQTPSVVTSTKTISATTTVFSTSMLTTTVSGTATTLTVTVACVTSCPQSNGGILYGELLGAIIAIVGVVIRGKR